MNDPGLLPSTLCPLFVQFKTSSTTTERENGSLEVAQHVSSTWGPLEKRAAFWLEAELP